MSAPEKNAFERVPIGDNALVNRYLKWLEDQYGNTGADEEPGSSTRVVFDSEAAGSPFLSVIVRTQGKRMEELVEALASLQVQRDRDFQLVVVCHNADDRVAAVGDVLGGLDGWLRERCTFLSVTGGTRSHPLNEAFPYVRGAYFSVLDEDDLVYDNWVSSFHDLAQGHPDHVLYCFVEAQQWRVQVGEAGIRRLTACSGLVQEYCKHPDPVQLLVSNQCPLMGLAFPSQLIHELGLRFDEGIDTTEDWDFFMRARNIYPFASSGERVALYRQWSEGGGYTAGSVDADKWESDYEAVQSTRSSMPLLFAPGFSDQVRNKFSLADSEEGYFAARMRMYLDAGEGFNERDQAQPSVDAKCRGIYEFRDLERFGGVRAIRIDPLAHGPLAIASFSITVHPAQGEPFEVDSGSVWANGRLEGGRVEFVGDDPQLVVEFGRVITVSRVFFRMQLASGLTMEDEAKPRSFFNRRKRA